MNYRSTLELSSDWFLSSYECSKDDFKDITLICNSNLTKNLVKNKLEKNYDKLLNTVIIEFGNELVEFNKVNSLFECSVDLFYNTLLSLQNKMSIYSIKVEAIKEKFMLLHSRLKRMKLLHEKIYSFINKTIVSHRLINEIKDCELDENYYFPFKCLLDKLNTLKGTNILRTNIGRELNLLLSSLFGIAVNRLKHKFISIFSNNESIFIIREKEYLISSKFSEFIKVSKLIKFLIINTTEFSFLTEKYINFVSGLFSQVVKEVEVLCENKDELGVLVTSKEFDKYNLMSEREQVLSNFYLLVSEPLDESFFSTQKKKFRIEEIFFKSQKMIYKAYISIYECTRQLFDRSLSDILHNIFSDHFIKIVELFQQSILKTNDTSGLAILYSILFKFERLSESKMKVFANAIKDSEVLFGYYKIQRKSIYISLESSINDHIYSLCTLSNREFKLFNSDRPSYINPISRRISEVLVILAKLFDQPDNYNSQIKNLVRRVSSSLISWLISSNEFLQNENNSGSEEGLIFIINNLDAIISALQGKNDVFLDDFQQVFREYIQKYIEQRLGRTYPEMQKIIDSKLCSNKVNVQYFSEVLEHFNKNWKENIDVELQTTLTSFSNFHTSEEILRILGTTIAMRYSQFINIIKGEEILDRILEKNKVDIEMILNYIQNCLNPGNSRTERKG